MMSNRKSILDDWKWVICVVGLMFLTIVLITGCTSQFRKLPESEVDVRMKSVAERIATNILEAQRDGRFEPLGSEATLIGGQVSTLDKVICLAGDLGAFPKVPVLRREEI